MSICQMIQAGLDGEYRTLTGYSLLHAIHICNLIYKRNVVDSPTPYPLPFIFGSIAFLHLPKEQRTKYDRRCIRGIYVGHAMTHGRTSCCFYLLTSKRVVVSRMYELWDGVFLPDVLRLSREGSGVAQLAPVMATALRNAWEQSTEPIETQTSSME